MRMQVQALLRGSHGRAMQIMFPFVADPSEFSEARALIMDVLAREIELGHTVPASLKVGAMLETPSLAFAPDSFFERVDFLSIGGNDLKQFFFAADRENELVRRRYDMLSTSFLDFIEMIQRRCSAHGTPLSFCGEDAGRPVEALALVAVGLRTLSMRPASIGPVKALLRQVDLAEVRAVLAASRSAEARSARPALDAWLAKKGLAT
jgi:phosphotransferase system enzyme I (PtsP)